MTPKERADRANRLLEDPVFLEAMRDIRENIVRLIESTAMGDVDTQHELALSLTLLKRIPAQFRQYADALVIEKHQKQQQSFMDRMKQRLT